MRENSDKHIYVDAIPVEGRGRGQGERGAVTHQLIPHNKRGGDGSEAAF